MKLCYIFYRFTMDSFFKILFWQHIQDGDGTYNMNYRQFRSSWMSFLNLMDIDYKDGFMCQICGNNPGVVVMDAIVMGLQKSMMPADKTDNTKTAINERSGR